MHNTLHQQQQTRTNGGGFKTISQYILHMHLKLDFVSNLKFLPQVLCGIKHLLCTVRLQFINQHNIFHKSSIIVGAAKTTIQNQSCTQNK